MWFNGQKMKTFIYILGLIVWSSFYFSCGNHVDSPVRKLFPEKPDTTHLPELAIFLEPEQLNAIIDEPTLLSNGKKRLKGIISVPQDGDDFRRDSLDEVYWRKVSIVEGDFRGASLRSGRCEEGNYRKSDFRVADVRWTIFDGSTMDSINFEQSRLFHVKVNDVPLSYSNFRGANMFGMEGHFAKLRHCDFSGALMKDSEFIDADLTGSKAVKAKLFRAVLIRSRLDSCDFSYADFTGAGLEESTFINSRLWYANFQGGHLQGTNFQGADLKGCNFFGTEFENTNFNGALNIPDEIKAFINKDGLATGIWQDAQK